MDYPRKVIPSNGLKFNRNTGKYYRFLLYLFYPFFIPFFPVKSYFMCQKMKIEEILKCEINHNLPKSLNTVGFSLF